MNKKVLFKGVQFYSTTDIKNIVKNNQRKFEKAD